jgi:hypothetical protein
MCLMLTNNRIYCTQQRINCEQKYMTWHLAKGSSGTKDLVLEMNHSLLLEEARACQKSGNLTVKGKPNLKIRQKNICNRSSPHIRIRTTSLAYLYYILQSLAVRAVERKSLIRTSSPLPFDCSFTGLVLPTRSTPPLDVCHQAVVSFWSTRPLDANVERFCCLGEESRRVRQSIREGRTTYTPSGNVSVFQASRCFYREGGRKSMRTSSHIRTGRLLFDSLQGNFNIQTGSYSRNTEISSSP